MTTQTAFIANEVLSLLAHQTGLEAGRDFSRTPNEHRGVDLTRDGDLTVRIAVSGDDVVRLFVLENGWDHHQVAQASFEGMPAGVIARVAGAYLLGVEAR